jgi:hypothetical protein
MIVQCVAREPMRLVALVFRVWYDRHPSGFRVRLNRIGDDRHANAANILVWQRERDSVSRAPCRFCKLHKPRCQECQNCQRCRGALPLFAPNSLRARVSMGREFSAGMLSTFIGAANRRRSSRARALPATTRSVPGMPWRLTRAGTRESRTVTRHSASGNTGRARCRAGAVMPGATVRGHLSTEHPGTT